MKIVQIQFTPWDKAYNFDPAGSVLLPGDYVVVKTELGVEIGKVVGFKEIKGEEELPSDAKAMAGKEKKEIKPILRKATLTDLEKVSDKKQKKEALEYCKKLVSQYKLPMKLVDVHFSFDGSRLTFAFVADGRVDFRELVKDLTRRFSRTIRLQQIGIRDEAKISGDYGHCGYPLCCKKFLTELSSVTSEMAELQQVAHRGSDRISGICGRLMCCLNYEEEGYEHCAKKLPPIGVRVDVDGEKGVVVRHHVLKHAVSVEFPAKNGEGKRIVEVDLNRKKQ